MDSHNPIAKLFFSCFEPFLKLLYAKTERIENGQEDNPFFEFIQQIENPNQVQLETLLKILEYYRNTKYFSFHSFEGIASVEEFQAKQPLSAYEDVSEYIIEIANGGDYSCLLPEPVINFALSSGTSGKTRKMIPHTATSLGLIRKRFVDLPDGILHAKTPTIMKRIKDKKGVAFLHIGKTITTEAGIEASGLTTAVLKNSMSHEILSQMYFSPLEVFLTRNHEEALLGHWKYALLNRQHIYFLRANFSGHIYEALQFLESGWEKIVSEIRQGGYQKGRGKLDLVAANMDIANMVSLNDQDLIANTLEDEFNKGFENIVERLFPNLQIISCITTGAFAIYQKLLRKYIPKRIPIYSPMIAASEGVFGINTSPLLNEVRYTLYPSSAFFEYIKEEDLDKEDPPTYLMHELEVGNSYETVITNFQGLFRYRQGDVVKVTGFEKNTPQVEFRYRVGAVLNIDQERTSEAMLTESIEKMGQTMPDGIQVVDFTSYPDVEGLKPRYRFFLELNGLDGIEKLGIQPLALALDEALGEANFFYRTNRESGRLGMARVTLVQSGTFRGYADMARDLGTDPTQFKPPRCIAEQHIAMFESQVVMDSV
mmetsp:Transcript_18728/g.24728  ORF Transcript_18728/g.24728 Transcript_18728/m.24728 type:complete len:598 (-) Transcript_18728:260-2053(-)